MPRIALEVLAAIALTLAAIITSATGVMASSIMVTEAFARASATPMAKAGAAYVSVMNHGAEADRLVSVSTDAAQSAELHVTRMEGDVMKMEASGPVDVAAGATLAMDPGGLHIMLTGLKAPLKEGQSIRLTLQFEKAGALDVDVPVGSVAATGHDHASGG